MGRASGSTPVALRLAFATACAVAPVGALAFNPHGHEVIEAHAYLAMLEPSFRGPTGEPGREVLLELMLRGLLRAPPCASHARIPDCPAEGDDLREFLPPLGSGEPDLILTRQLDPDSQCFHFNARPEDVLAHPLVDPRVGAPPLLQTHAYPRCVRAVTSMVGLTVRRDAATPQIDLYVAMHAVADAFSEAHVVRNEALDDIQYVKPWRTAAFPTYAVNWSGFDFWDTRFHHDWSDDYDGEYVLDAFERAPGLDAARHCRAILDPYQVPRSCLTARARAASRALVDLMLAVHRIARLEEASPGAPGGAFGSAAADEAWRGFVKVHLHSERVPADYAFDPGLEWVPRLMLGARAGGTTGGVESAAAAMRMRLPQFTAFSPLVYEAEGQFGWRGASVSAGFGVPITNEVSLSLPSPRLEILDGDLDLTVPLLRVDTFWLDRLWVAADAFPFSFSGGAVERRAGLTVGVAFDADPFEVFEGAFRGVARWIGDPPPARTTAELVAQYRDRWQIPPDARLQPSRRDWTVVHGLLESGGGDGGGHLAMHSFQWIRDVDDHGLRSGPAPYVRLAAARAEAREGRMYWAPLAASGLRVYVVDGALALEAEVAARAGVGEDAFGASDVMPAAVAFAIGYLEVAVEGPRFGIYPATVPGLQYVATRVGVRTH